MDNTSNNQLVQVAGTEIQKIEYKGQPVVTFAMIDKLHNRTDGTAKRAFSEAKARFNARDFVEVGRDEIRTNLNNDVFSKFASKGLLITRKGYLKFVKILNDDRAWEVMDDMIDVYFAAKSHPANLIPNFNDPIEAAKAWVVEAEARKLAEQTKAQIGAKREATAMNTASQAVKKQNKLLVELDKHLEYATVKRVEKASKEKYSWRDLKAVAEEMKKDPVKVPDRNYGYVNSYHADVWQEAYGVDIAHLNENGGQA